MYLELAKARKDLPVRVLGNFHRLKKKNGAIVHFYNLERRIEINQIPAVIRLISQNLSKLKEECTIRINISRNGIVPRDLKFFTDADWSSRVSMVTLKMTKLYFYGAADLSSSKWKNVKKIDLSRNRIEDNECTGIGLACWPQLQSINLKYNQISCIGCSRLTAPRWFKLQYLNLSLNNIGDSGVEHLSKGPWALLQHLDLKRCQLTCLSCQHITKANWRKMHTLKLESNFIRDKGMLFFSKNVWPHLHTLILKGSIIGSKGIAALSKMHFKVAKRSNFDFTNNPPICDQACPYLLRSQFSKLRNLFVRGNQISQYGCLMLLQNQNWRVYCDAQLD